MNEPINVIVLVEGKTEKVFVDDLLAPSLWNKMIFVESSLISPNGGDVKFDRVQHLALTQLKKRSDAYVTTMVDYYGVKEWPGVENVPQNATPRMIADHIRKATMEKIGDKTQFPDNLRADKRFVPYMAVHEFETLLFSESAILASALQINEDEINAVLTKFGEPEAVNDNPQTAPSKRLDKWCGGKFRKTTLGIDIAKKIGLPKMREQCPIFNEWLLQLENLDKLT